jgi:hypothetical protein
LYAFTGWWTVDDAYIYAEYAQNLSDGDGMVFYPGQKVAAYSGLLYPLLMSIFVWLNINPVVNIQVFSILVYILGFRLLEKHSSDAMRPVLLVAWCLPIMWVHTISGLETMVFGVLIMYNFNQMFLRPDFKLNAPGLILLALCRFDGIAIAGVFVLWYIVILFFFKFDLKKYKTSFYHLVAFAAVMFAVGVWFLNNYDGLPSSWLIKGQVNIWFIVTFIVFVFMVLSAGLNWSRHNWFIAAIAATVVVLMFSTYLFSRPLMNYSHRFYIHFLPLGFLIAGQFKPEIPVRSILLGGLVFVFAFNYKHEFNFIQEYQQIDQQLEAVAKDMAKRDYKSVVAVDIGMLGYYTDFEIVDLVGLATPEIIGKDRVEYIYKRLPDALLLPSRSNQKYVYQNWDVPRLLQDDRFKKYYKFLGVYQHPVRSYWLFERM